MVIYCGIRWAVASCPGSSPEKQGEEPGYEASGQRVYTYMYFRVEPDYMYDRRVMYVTLLSVGWCRHVRFIQRVFDSLNLIIRSKNIL